MKPSKFTLSFSLVSVAGIVMACGNAPSDDVDLEELDDQLSLQAKPKKDSGVKDTGVDVKETGSDAQDSGADVKEAGPDAQDSGADVKEAGADAEGGTSPSFLDACLLPGATRATFFPYGSIHEGDEGATAALPLPFAFRFMGANQTHFWLTSNGELGFGTSPGGVPFGQARCPLPDSQTAKPIVFVYALDLMSAVDVCMATTGTAPNRKLEVTWKNMLMYQLDGSGNGTSNLAFGATLNEGTNAIDIRMHRAEVNAFWTDDDAAIAAGSMAVVGVQSGGSAISYSCNQTNAPPGSVFHYVSP